MAYYTLHSFLKQTNPFIRFLLVGVINTMVGLSIIFILMNSFTLNYWISTFIGNGIGSLVSFLLNRRFTFNSHVSFHKGLPVFFIVIILCYFGSYSFSRWLSEEINFLNQIVSPEDTAVLMGTCFYTISNYFGQKYVVFKIKE